MYSQFSLVKFSSVALTTTSSKMFDCARNMMSLLPVAPGRYDEGRLEMLRYIAQMVSGDSSTKVLLVIRGSRSVSVS